MFKKGILILTLGLFVVGCGKTESTDEVVTETVYVEVPAEIPMQEELYEVPTAGKGSIKGDLDCEGGTITTNYSFGQVDQDDKEFLIEYQRNGVTEDLTYPSASSTGSRMIVKDIYYAGENDSERPVYWVVTVVYQTPGQTYDLVTTTIKQPACTEEKEEDSNTTSLVTTYTVQ